MALGVKVLDSEVVPGTWSWELCLNQRGAGGEGALPAPVSEGIVDVDVCFLRRYRAGVVDADVFPALETAGGVDADVFPAPASDGAEDVAVLPALPSEGVVCEGILLTPLSPDPTEEDPPPAGGASLGAPDPDNVFEPADCWPVKLAISVSNSVVSVSIVLISRPTVCSNCCCDIDDRP